MITLPDCNISDGSRFYDLFFIEKYDRMEKTTKGRCRTCNTTRAAVRSSARQKRSLRPSCPIWRRSSAFHAPCSRCTSAGSAACRWCSPRPACAKVNAALAVQTVLDTISPDFVLNAGTAGGMSPALGLFETAVTTECAYHDVAEAILTESHPHLPSVWFASDPDLLAACRRAAERAPGRVHFGRTVTGEAFITDEGRAEINARFAPLTVDMETAAMAHVCYVNRVPFAAIRSVTDTADHSGIGTFEENCARASAVSAALVLDVLRELTR